MSVGVCVIHAHIPSLPLSPLAYQTLARLLLGFSHALPDTALAWPQVGLFISADLVGMFGGSSRRATGNGPRVDNAVSYPC